jgi:hypothetical protein
MHVIGSDFIKMLIICLSARPAAATIYTERNLTVPNNTSIDVNKHPDSAKKPPREEPPAKKPRNGDTKTIPTYETTNERGEKHRVSVRLFDDEELAMMDWKVDKVET